MPLNLIIGGDSTIGKALSSYWKEKDIRHHSSTRSLEHVSSERPFIELVSQSWSISKGKYDTAVFCAGATKLSECEEYPKETREINVDGTIALADALSKNDTYQLFLSTNQVFDGTQPFRTVKDKVCPINEYGQQKAEAEKEFSKFPKTAILRLTKVVHPEWQLLKNWRIRLDSGFPIEAFTDMYIAPVSIQKVVRRIEKLMDSRHPGIYHLSGEKDISYYDFAKSYFSFVQGAEELIRRSTRQRSRIVQKNNPLYTSLQ